VIEQLPLLVPSAARTDRTRARCHKQLARHFRPRAPQRFAVERAVFIALGAIYLSSLALDVVRVFSS